jgi:hypothetical protein
MVSAGHGLLPVGALLVSLIALGCVSAICDPRTSALILAFTCVSFAVAITRDDSVSAAEGTQPILLAMFIWGTCVVVRRLVVARMELNRMQLDIRLAEARA